MPTRPSTSCKQTSKAFSAEQAALNSCRYSRPSTFETWDPQRFTQVELERLISAAKARGEAELARFIETAASLGLACADMVHFTKDIVPHSNGVMMYKRRKIREQTSRAKLRIHPALREKLLNANESDDILWNGKDGRDERRHHLDYTVPRVVRVAGAIQKGAKEHMGYATRLRNSGSTPG